MPLTYYTMLRRLLLLRLVLATAAPSSSSTFAASSSSPTSLFQWLAAHGCTRCGPDGPVRPHTPPPGSGPRGLFVVRPVALDASCWTFRPRAYSASRARFLTHASAPPSSTPACAFRTTSSSRSTSSMHGTRARGPSSLPTWPRWKQPRPTNRSAAPTASSPPRTRRYSAVSGGRRSPAASRSRSRNRSRSRSRSCRRRRSHRLGRSSRSRHRTYQRRPL